MERVRKRKRKYKFSGKKHSIKGIISLTIGLLSDICLFVSVRLAFLGDGSLSLYAGSIGLLSMVAGIVALVMGIVSCTDEEVYKLYPGLGILCGALATLLWMGVYLVGMIN